MEVKSCLTADSYSTNHTRNAPSIQNRGESYRIFAPTDTKYLRSLTKPSNSTSDPNSTEILYSNELLYGGGKDRTGKVTRRKSFTKDSYADSHPFYPHESEECSTNVILSNCRGQLSLSPHGASTNPYHFNSATNLLQYDNEVHADEVLKMQEEIAAVKRELANLNLEVRNMYEDMRRVRQEMEVIRSDNLRLGSDNQKMATATSTNSLVASNAAHLNNTSIDEGTAQDKDAVSKERNIHDLLRREEIIKLESSESNKLVIHLRRDNFTAEEVLQDMHTRCPRILDHMESHTIYDKSRTMIFVYSSAKTAQEASNRLQARLRDLAHQNGHSPILKSVGVSKPPVIRELRQWSQRVKERNLSLPIVVYAEMPVLGKVFADGRRQLHSIRLDWAVKGPPAEDTVVLFLSVGMVISKVISRLEPEGFIQKLKELGQWPEFSNGFHAHV